MVSALIEKKLIRVFWWRGQDSNLRPPGYEPDELPTAPPRDAVAFDHVTYNIAQDYILVNHVLNIS